jgi:hypothetical protein
MPAPRLNPERPLTPAEKQKRAREAQAAYMRALEAAVADADCYSWNQTRRLLWKKTHIATIQRAKAAQQDLSMTPERSC